MIPNLDFIRTMLDGIRESIFARINNTKSYLEREIAKVDGKIHTPDYAATEKQPGYIKNKPILVGKSGEGEYSEIFNHYDGANTASGAYSHAEGNETTASGDYGSHAEGNGTRASGRWGSHAEGMNTVASGNRSHAEGTSTVASGLTSHAEGHGTRAAASYQHVQGIFNVESKANKYAHIVGNGTDENARSNCHTLDWDGNAWFAGDIYVGGTSQDHYAAKKVLTDIPTWNELENKPFYKKTVSEYRINNQIFNLTITGDISYYSYISSHKIQFKETLVVNWNGVEYTTTTCYLIDSNGRECVFLGDVSKFVDYGAGLISMPFGILQRFDPSDNSLEFYIISNEALTTVTLSIYSEREQVTPIDPQYLQNVELLNLADKPFVVKEEVDKNIVFPKINLLCQNSSMYGPNCVVSGALFLVEGAKYMVTIDDIEYETTCRVFEFYTGRILYLGNLALADVPGCPESLDDFCIVSLGDKTSFHAPLNSANNSSEGNSVHSFEVQEAESKAREITLKKEFLPTSHQFGSEYGVSTILENTTLALTASYNSQYTFKWLDSTLDLVAGEVYFVGLNGVKYRCVAQSYTDENGGDPYDIVYLGDVSAQYSNIASTGEPFGIYRMLWASNDTDTTQVISNENLESISLSIFYQGEVVTPLDAKYMPEHVHKDYADKINGKFTNSVSLGRRSDTTIGQQSAAFGTQLEASGYYAFAQGAGSKAKGWESAAFGDNTKASSRTQFALGKYNVEDTGDTYALIVGNGTYEVVNSVVKPLPSNAHTLDWDGNAWYAGTVEGTAMIISSPNGTRFKITVGDDGALSATAIT